MIKEQIRCSEFITCLMLIGTIFFACNEGSSHQKRVAERDSILPDKMVAVDTTGSMLQPSTDTLPAVNKVVVRINESDTMNSEADADYGIGDDDAFTAADFKVYRIKDGSVSQDLKQVNDYRLTTAVKSMFGGRDTIILVIWFPGLVNPTRKEPLISVSGLSLFNGNRNNYQVWKESGGIKKMSLAINQQVLDTGIILQNTYKCQDLNFSFKPLYNLSGHKDTIKIIVEDIYPGKNKEYNISEIKLDAKRLY